MRTLLAWGLVLGTSLAGTTWARQITTPAPVTGRFTSADSMFKIFTVETTTARITFKTDAQTVFVEGGRHVGLSNLRVGDQVRVRYSGEGADRTAAHVEALPSSSTGSDAVTGRVAFVDVAERRVTIDATNASIDMNAMNPGDEVRIVLASGLRTADRIDVLSAEVSEGGARSANGPQPARSRVPRRLFGVSLLAMAGTAVVLRARQHRTLHCGRELVDDINRNRLFLGS
jgi:hypothetical protein